MLEAEIPGMERRIPSIVIAGQQFGNSLDLTGYRGGIILRRVKLHSSHPKVGIFSQVRACKTISWANMKEQRSEAPLLFHRLAPEKRLKSPENSLQVVYGLY